MSAGRFEWTATRYEHRDEVTGACLVISKTRGGWDWVVGAPKFTIAGGKARSPSAAKGAARKALEAFKVKRVAP